MALAAIAAGADSLMIEVHPDPAKALSDGPQSLTPQQYDELMQQMAVMSQTVSRWSQNFLNNRIMMNETHTATFKNFLEERGFSHANRTT
ncbi:hypothetical protein NUACC26_059160 [Scytonema sp. NUACC26]